ncbi:MAG TPA: DUF362 domain-containing protein [Prolixibacteraceae bacterium]|nr:DUF362 domain-containing protein [Prolixibacteraceae bacterium]
MKKINLSKVKQALLRCKVPARFTFFSLGIASTVWFLVRVIPKPSRATYPCMKAASPFMSGFVIYLVGAMASLFSFKKSLFHFKQSKFLSGMLLCMVAVLTGLVVNFSVSSGSERLSVASGPEQFEPNKPVGVAHGIFPGRVVWARDPDATSNYYKIPSYDLSNNDSAIINRLTQQTILSLTGKNDLKEAWDLLFKSFNEKRGNGNIGYQAGQKIFIKINCNSAWGHPAVSGTEFNYYGASLGRALNEDYSFKKTAGSYGTFEGNPYTMLSIIDQLVNKAGVPQEDISIGDPMRDIHKYTYDMLHNAFPNVHYMGHSNTYGRTLVEPSQDTLVYFSDNGKVLLNYAGKPLKGIPLYSVVEDADYIINLAALKAHTGEGVTSSAKNYFGTIARIWAIEMHGGMVSPAFSSSSRAAGSYRVLVDLMGSKHLGGKTMLFFVDGTFFCCDAYGPNLKLKNPPFNNDWPSSVFASQDNVAIESVCYDILASQYSTSCGFPSITLKGICEHLQQAADPSSWPTGISYCPDRDGIPMKSLGVYEHWNNATDQQYSRNLGTDNGIELIKIGSVEDLIAAPVQLSVKSFSDSQVELTWKDNSDKEEGYVIECSKDDSLHYSQVGEVVKDTLRFVFREAEGSTQYYFRVRASKGEYKSGCSNEVSAVTFSTASKIVGYESILKVIPCQNGLNLSLQNDYRGTVLVRITDLSGRTVFSEQFLKTQNFQEEVFNPSLKRNFYIVTVTSGSSTVSRKVELF